MKNRFKILGIVVAAALLVIGLTACDNFDIRGRTPGMETYGSFTLNITGGIQPGTGNYFNRQIAVIDPAASLFSKTAGRIGVDGKATITVYFTEKDVYPDFAPTAGVDIIVGFQDPLTKEWDWDIAGSADVGGTIPATEFIYDGATITVAF